MQWPGMGCDGRNFSLSGLFGILGEVYGVGLAAWGWEMVSVVGFCGR